MSKPPQNPTQKVLRRFLLVRPHARLYVCVLFCLPRNVKYRNQVQPEKVLEYRSVYRGERELVCFKIVCVSRIK